MDGFIIDLPVNKKRMVVWGTGIVAAELLGRIHNKVDFFIDNDERKWEKRFYGKKIKAPGTILEWKDIYLLIAVRNANAIEQQVAGYGLRRFVDYEFYYDSVPDDDFSKANEVIQHYLSELEGKEHWKNSCVFLGTALATVDGLETYFNNWNQSEKTMKILQVEEAGKELSKVSTMALPYFLSDHICSHSCRESKVDEEIITYVKESKMLMQAARNMRRRQEQAQPLHEYGCVYYYYLFLTEIIKWIKPSCFIIWNTFKAYHSIAEDICKQQGVRVIHGELGVLPGTYTFDTMGEMGASVPAVYATEFKKLPVTRAEYQKAGEIWSYIRKSGANRRVQWKGNINIVRSKIDSSKPVVFVSGQNDEASGIYPYTENSKKYHSPIFTSSVDAVCKIGKLAKENNWNVIYKPHPYASFSNEDRIRIPANVIMAEGIGINHLIEMSSVVVTIVSQTAYMALIHQKPVLMLGYIQLRDKQCTYQAFTEDAIEPELRAAIKNGFTDSQQNAFQTHIAQLVKYYLYDDGCDRKIRYGRGYPANMDDLMCLERTLKKMRGELENDHG